ncbi:hypothetical protein CHS0354_039375, partial [Potamilus streckersoni]
IDGLNYALCDMFVLSTEPALPIKCIRLDPKTKTTTLTIRIKIANAYKTKQLPPHEDQRWIYNMRLLSDSEHN